MARQIHRLSPKAVVNKKQPGYYPDGLGLYLQISATGSKSWIFRFMLAGRAREMGLGSLNDVSLAEARDSASHNRQLLRAGIDPIEARDNDKARSVIEGARSITFAECAKAYVKAHKAGWKNAKHIDQWTNTLESYCGPVIGTLPVQAVDTGLVLKVLEPIWAEKPETATRLRARIERVLDWATVRGYRTGENPSRWRGHLDKLLPALKKKLRVKHHPALPYVEIGEFMVKLRAQEGVAARALQFAILTAARTDEVISAQWDEFDLKAALWTIPAERMKAHREHRVPLSAAALEILKAQRKAQHSKFVFPGQTGKTPLSNMAMIQLLKGMHAAKLAEDGKGWIDPRGERRIVPHGFRSTFRDWASERTNYPREVCEMALAHVVSDQTEAAYRRGDLFEKRRRIMQDWAKFCDTPHQTGKVLPMKRKRVS